jgi:hypothetical protein
MQKKYLVRLSEDERNQLLSIVKTAKGSASKIKLVLINNGPDRFRGSESRSGAGFGNWDGI